MKKRKYENNKTNKTRKTIFNGQTPNRENAFKVNDDDDDDDVKGTPVREI